MTEDLALERNFMCIAILDKCVLYHENNKIYVTHHEGGKMLAIPLVNKAKGHESTFCFEETVDFKKLHKFLRKHGRKQMLQIISCQFVAWRTCVLIAAAAAVA